MRRLLAAALILAPASAMGLPLLVDNPQMCDMPPDSYRLEDGMILGSNYMETIEYYCEFDPPVDFRWDVDTTTVARVGWCNEPGYIKAEVFAFQFSQYDPGVVLVYGDEFEEPQTFTACPE